MPQELFYTIFESPPGWMGLLGSADGICRVVLPQPTDVKAVYQVLENTVKASPSPGFFKDLVERLQEYFTGKEIAFNDGVDYSEATRFQREIWEAARKIPYGKTHTYAWVAAQAGRPLAVRAAGQALARNPVPIIVPCHRVTATGGGLGGFSGTGGLTTKEYLLKLESNRHQKQRGGQLSLDFA